jgi:hypothetical protein
MTDAQCLVWYDFCVANAVGGLLAAISRMGNLRFDSSHG